jgi:septum site-determining protein MinC
MDRASSSERRAFKVKGTAPALTMLSLLTVDMDAIEEQLAEHVGQMPQFFLHAPIILDVEALGDTQLDFARVSAVLRKHRLVPVAVRNPSDRQKEHAVAAGWGVLQSGMVRPGRAAPAHARIDVAAPRGSSSHSPRRMDAGAPPDAASVDQNVAGLTVQQPVRSGQVVHAVGGDLVCLSPVSSGAELIADGNIHVYAPLRGRALAGANDNPRVYIFCMSLEAEFLSIAGRHLMSEEIPKASRGRPARVHLEGERLVVTNLLTSE